MRPIGTSKCGVSNTKRDGFRPVLLLARVAGLKVGVVLPLINRRTSAVGRTSPKNLKKVDNDASCKPYDCSRRTRFGSVSRWEGH